MHRDWRQVIGSNRWLSATVAFCALFGLGCGHQPPKTAQVREIYPGRKPAPSGYYRVVPGDNLYRIALTHHQNYKQLAALNHIADPTKLEAGQLLRLNPSAKGGTQFRRPTRRSGHTTAPCVGNRCQRQVSRDRLASQRKSAPKSSSKLARAQPQYLPSASTANPAKASAALHFIWPSRGQVVQRFDGQRNKGIDIAGAGGQPVYAVAAGKVVYAGNGLRGYGNLIILKHRQGDFLTVYAHNRKLKVQEGQQVRQRQQIAELGHSDSEQFKLHFEVRHRGRPLDPLLYLPRQLSAQPAR